MTMLSKWELISSFLTIFLVCLLWGNQRAIPEDKSIKEVTRNSMEYQKGPQLTFIQPFNLFFQHYDFHVMLYFKGHPEYEAVEAMIEEQGRKEPLIRVIITRHDQTQIDHINNKEIVKRMQISKAEREVYYTPIQYLREERNGRAHIHLRFNSFRGESVSFVFYAVAKPLPRYGGLTDPGRHAEKSTLPIMWRERSTLASPKSKISFDGKDYKIPVKIWIPIFFKGMKGYYTEGFSIGVITTGQVGLELVKVPEKNEVGEEWVYRVGEDKLIYKIIERNKDQVVIKKASETLETIHGRIVNDHLEMGEIRVTSRSGKKEVFAIKFNPSLPDMIAMTEGQESISRFSISINDRKALVVGTIGLKREADRILLSLNPEQPNWAVKRAVEVTIDVEDNKYYIRSVIRSGE